MRKIFCLKCNLKYEIGIKPTEIINEGCIVGFKVLHLALEVKLSWFYWAKRGPRMQSFADFLNSTNEYKVKVLLFHNLKTENRCYKKLPKYIYIYIYIYTLSEYFYNVYNYSGMIHCTLKKKLEKLFSFIEISCFLFCKWYQVICHLFA